MKITFVLPCPNLAGGIRVVGIYAKHLHERGHTVTLVSVPEHQPTLMAQVKSVLRGKGLNRRISRPPSHLDSLSMEHRKIKRLRPIVDADVPDADIVVATWWETANWVAALSPSKGKKVYLLQHYEIFDYLPVEQVKATWALPLYKVVVAQWLVNIAREEFGDPNTACIPNAIDPVQFFAAPRTKQPVPTIGLVYADAYWKGPDIAVNAINLAKKTIPNLQVIAFGHPPRTAVDLDEDVQYWQKPSQDKLREIYAQCDAWLFSSRFEGFGLPILEAMACRTPVIGTPAGAAPELLAEGAGILVQPEDPEDMARAIVQVCQMSNAEWQTMSDLAYEQVSRYTWEDATDRLEAVFNSLITSQLADPAPSKGTPPERLDQPLQTIVSLPPA